MSMTSLRWTLVPRGYVYDDMMYHKLACMIPRFHNHCFFNVKYRYVHVVNI
jgi:hypothetical protein